MTDAGYVKASEFIGALLRAEMAATYLTEQPRRSKGMEERVLFEIRAALVSVQRALAESS